jgi:SpoIID/LytB domain protein
MSPTRSVRRATVVLGALLVAGLLVAAPPASAGAPPVTPAGGAGVPVDGEVVTLSGASTLRVSGRGFGHGIGLGQWGSLGYAVDHGWSHTQILDHYYGGSSASTVPDRVVTVRLLAHDNQGTHVYLQEGQMTITTLQGQVIAQQDRAIRFRRIAPNTFTVSDAPSCAGPWVERPGVTVATSTIRIEPPAVANPTVAQSLGVCLGGGDVRWYRGEIRAVADAQGIQRTVNAVSLEAYLRGVVPRESPASWGGLGGGAGMNALRAQAVAARTYTIAENRYAYAQTCDTTACHVYSGRYQRIGGRDAQLEHPNTDRAIADTAGEVRVRNGSPIYAYYSSSTGGHTVSAGSPSSSGWFPAVPDVGDAVASNPSRSWTAEIPVSAIESRYQRGTLRSITVLERNGLGDDGGRVTRLRLSFSGGDVDLTGNQFRSAFSTVGGRLTMRSDWFTPLGGSGTPVAADTPVACPAAGQGQIARLYLAYFLRAPDAGGLAHWVGRQQAGQSLASISGFFAGSPEFVARYGSLGNAAFVDLVYTNVLGRAPDAGGRAYWLGLLDSRRQGRGSVMLNFSESAEFKAKTGNCA